MVIASHQSGWPMFKSQNQCLFELVAGSILCFDMFFFSPKPRPNSNLMRRIHVSNYFGPLAYQFLRLSCLKTKGTFVWDDLDQDQWSEISWIMVDQNEPMKPCPEWIHQFIILIYHDPSDPWSLILIQIIPNECTLTLLRGWLSRQLQKLPSQ